MEKSVCSDVLQSLHRYMKPGECGANLGQTYLEFKLITVSLLDKQEEHLNEKLKELHTHVLC